jgi:hypothetical protein
MVRALATPVLTAIAGPALVVALAAALAGCTPGPMIDRLPGEMGLPADAPARPVTPYQYPAVHDMPPPRPTAPMTEEQQRKAEKDLATARDRQEGRPAVSTPATASAAKRKTAVVTKKIKPAAPIPVPPAGSKTNP